MRRVGVVAGLGAAAFYALLDSTRWFFTEYLIGYHPMGPGGETPLIPSPDVPFRRWLLLVVPALGGLLSGIIVYTFAPETEGHGIVQQAMIGHLNAGLLFTLAPAKILTTSLTIGSGGSGGVFGPAVVIGGSLGGGVGLLMQSLFPSMHLEPGAFAMVGMAGFFAAAADTPLSTIIMVSEMTGNYHLLVPSMWVCVIGFMLCRPWSIYANQLGSRFDAPIHTENMLKAVLRRLPVSDVI